LVTIQHTTVQVSKQPQLSKAGEDKVWSALQSLGWRRNRQGIVSKG